MERSEMIDRRHLDVWFIQTNVVYSVVTDWLQQGRLLGEDQLRYSGTEKWVTVSTVTFDGEESGPAQSLN
jgi:hypothetical protein